MKKAYKVALIQEEKGYTVYIPAFDGWTEGTDLADALYMASDYIGITGITLEDIGKTIPEDVEYVSKEGEIESYVAVDFAEYRRKKDNKKVRKSVTIKSWLNDAAEKQGVNFSATLEAALMEKLQL